MENNSLTEMKKFLKGIHMGGATFKDYLEKAQSEKLKIELKEIIESFKRHEEAITHRIEQMGGDAPDTLGVMGTIADFWEKIKLIAVNNDSEVCEHAIEAMNMGIKQGNKFIEENKNLDESLKKEVKAVVSDYNIHLTKIKNLGNELNNK